MENEKEMLERTHIEALTKEWMFQCAEGIETYPKDRMFEICYEDAYKQGKKEANEKFEKLKQEIRGVIYIIDNCSKNELALQRAIARVEELIKE